MSKRITFRADASLVMGNGHVMRCLTLAEQLRERGAECDFICREHPGHLLELIRQRGFRATGLAPYVPGGSEADVGGAAIHALPTHAGWLGSSWQVDAEQTAALLGRQGADWLIVDHYALDQRWERALRRACQRLMVIDDLADRAHDCDLLLDQNLGRASHDYTALVEPACRLLTGARYAMLRPGFAALRDASIGARGTGKLERILITMGGVDQPNSTSRALAALRLCQLDDATRITVVMGPTAPWLAAVRELATQMPWPTEVLVNISDMAERMATSDLAVGAAGSAAWERCSLGLPTLMVVLADNQRPGAEALQRAGAAILVGEIDDIAHGLTAGLAALRRGNALAAMSQAAAAVTSGRGVELVVQEMEAEYGSAA